MKTAEAELRTQQLSSRCEQLQQLADDQKTKLSKMDEVQKEELSKKQVLIDKKEAEKDTLRENFERLRRAVKEKDEQLFKLQQEKMQLGNQVREKDGAIESLKNMKAHTIKECNTSLDEKRVEIQGLKNKLGQVSSDLNTQKNQGQKLEQSMFLLEKKNADLQQKVVNHLQKIVELEKTNKELQRQKNLTEELYLKLQQKTAEDTAK